MTRSVFIFSVFLILSCVGCDQQNVTTEQATTEQAATEQAATHEELAKRPTAVSVETEALAPSKALLLHDPVDLALYETPSQALQNWYDLRATRPALLLYSNNPFLQVSSTAVLDDLLLALDNHNESALRFDTPNPAVLPVMTVDTAMRSSFFSAVYWMLPLSEDIEAISVETFRSQLIQSGALNPEEAKTLTLRNGIFSGKVRGLPFYAVHPNADLQINGPAAVHFDLSYLAALYKGEFKTPTYPLIYLTLQRLRDYQIETVSASFSYSQISRQIPLGSRFVGDVFKQLFMTPKLLDERLPEDWQMRSNALYMPNMMMIGDTRNLLLKLAQKHPDDASLHYALYNVSRESSSTRGVALRHLADAVQRDPVYAYEYLYLAPQAREKDRPDEALRVLLLASEALPDDPYVNLELARGYIALGQRDKAEALLKKLKSLSWSKTLYPDMALLLDEMIAEAN